MLRRKLGANCTLESLLCLCTKYVARNLELYKSSDYLERFPASIKTAIVKYVTRVYGGFHSDDIFRFVLPMDLIKLNLSGSTVTGKTLQAIGSTCKLLQTLKLNGAVYTFTEKDLLAIIPKLRKLEVLQVSKCNAVSDNLLMYVAEYCPALNMIDVSGCKNITDESFEYFSKTNIERLNLANTNITDNFLQKLGQSQFAKSIEEINITDCNITDRGLSFLQWDKMKYIGFSGCSVGDLAFIQSNKNLQYIHWTIPK